MIPPPARGPCGLTVVELCVAIAIIAILAVLTLTGWHTIVRQAAKANCIGNMRSIHAGLAAYVADAGHWPQIPTALADDTESYETWWLTELQPFGILEKSWQCPVLARSRVKNSAGYSLRMHYVPTDFDANPISPSRWSTMPWLIEQGNNHGHGALVAFPDGSIRDSLIRR